MPIGQSSVELVTKYGNHLYQSDQKTYPSVTTILDCVAYNQHIVGWANYLGFKHIRYEDALKQTADRGTYVHAFNQYYVDPEHGMPPRISDDLTKIDVGKRCNNFLYELRKAEGYWKTIFTETPFVSHTYEIGGTVDWLAEWYGKTTIFDYKTSNALRDKHALQIGGYYYGLADNGITADQGCIILCRTDRCLFYFFNQEEMKMLGERFFRIYQYYKDHEEMKSFIASRT